MLQVLCRIQEFPNATQVVAIASVHLGTRVSSSNSLSEQLILALQTTLAEVETSSGIPPDDPAIVSLKSIILRKIADLELAKATEYAATETSALTNRTEPLAGGDLNLPPYEPVS